MPMTKYVADWIARADEDIYTAELLLKEKGAPNQICFHAQQAAEKYLKAFLAFYEKHIRKIHDLDSLSAECYEIDHSFSEIRADGTYLTGFYLGARYPGDMPEFDLEEGKKALESAKRIKSFVLTKIS